MSGTTNSFSMPDLNRKRKHKEGGPAAERDYDSDDSDSDCACIAPDSGGEKHVPVGTSCDTGPSVKGHACMGSPSVANGSSGTAGFLSAKLPSSFSSISWATKYVVDPVEPHNSTTADQGNEKEATTEIKDIEMSTDSITTAKTVQPKKTKTVWIIGDSWIHWVEKYAQKRREHFPNMKVYWFPQLGMRWSSLMSAIKNISGVPEADVLLIHCGAEDLCYLSRYDLTSAMKKDIEMLKIMFPETQVVFSCIPQRRVWVTTAALGTSLGRARRNINKFFAEFLGERGMFHIRHDNIIKEARLFRPDGIHLSDLGNKNLLQNIRTALEQLP